VRRAARGARRISDLIVESSDHGIVESSDRSIIAFIPRMYAIWRFRRPRGESGDVRRDVGRANAKELKMKGKGPRVIGVGVGASVRIETRSHRPFHGI
jgi:hypothetical protein